MTIAETFDEHVVKTYVRAAEVFSEGEGCILRDASGREWLDFLGGIAVSALGHAHPGLVEAVRDQIGRLTHVSNLYRHSWIDPAADLLCELSGMRAVFFTNSGAEANEAALKLARKHQRLHGRPERTAFVALHHGFHGRTMGALSVTANPKYREPFAPLIPGAVFVEPDDVDALTTALDEHRPAGLILEPIQGEGGVRPLCFEYLRAARRLCNETGTVLIHDEVQCGAGRTGRFLAAEHAGVTPDVATLAKPIAAGLPMGAMLTAEGFHDTLVPGDHGSTFAGGPLVCRGALVLLEALRDGLLRDVAARGHQLRIGLDALAAGYRRDARDEPFVTGVRGLGLMQALVVPGRSQALQSTLYDTGLITCTAAGDTVRFLPPYIVTPEEVDRALDLVDRALARLAASRPPS